MKLCWTISEPDVEIWRSFVAENINNAFVIERQKSNIDRESIDTSKDYLWHVLVGCQVTSVQRSGPNSAVSKFLNSKTPALSYEECLNTSNLEQMLFNELTRAGLRRTKIIANNLTHALNDLENGLWSELVELLKAAFKADNRLSEKKAADFLSHNFKGIGLKQSRNYIQWLGLSKHEIPLDSRITKVMKRLGVAFVPSASALGDESVYLMVQSGLQELAARLDIMPCILDACIFSSFDK